MKVSVIVPTYRDWSGLARCLDALAGQTLPASEFEVIVVDNDARSDPPPLPLGVRYLHAPQGWSYAARNAGAAQARGAVLAFTDADCLPTPEWLAALLEAFGARPDCDLIGGPIDIVAAHDNTAIRYERLFEFRQQELITREGYSVTANLAVRRSAFVRAGGFDARLKSCGDSEFCVRAGAGGHRIGYAESARVRHPARETLAEIFAKNRRIATGQHDRVRREAAQGLKPLWAGLLYAWRPRPREWYHLLAGNRGSGIYPPARRLPVMLLRAALHYHLAACMLRSQLSGGRADRDVR